VVEEVLEPEPVKSQPEAWRCIGQEISEQLDYEPARFLRRLTVLAATSSIVGKPPVPPPAWRRLCPSTSPAPSNATATLVTGPLPTGGPAQSPWPARRPVLSPGTPTALRAQPYVLEADLDAEITALIKPFSLREDWAEAMLTRVKEEKKQAAQSSLTVAASKRAEIEKLNSRLQILLDSLLDGIIEREVYVAEKAKVMSQKKTLEEQQATLQQGKNNWLEPLANWVNEAKNTGKIALSGSLHEKKALAKKVFGSNLVLDRKKARGSCLKPWSLLLETSSSSQLVPATGLEGLQTILRSP
jgi:hypothetical protein